MKLLLVLFFLATSVYAQPGCGPNIVYLNSGEIHFYTLLFRCEVTFILNSTNSENIRGYAMIRSFEEYLVSEFSYQFFNTTYRSLTTNYYLEGYVIFEEMGGNESDSKCALESISKDKPFEIMDENLFVYLTNTYNELTSTYNSCKWQFVAPHGYGFKVVIEIFELDSSTEFRIENSTDLLINERSVRETHPIYNSDTYIQIYIANTGKNLRFNGYLTIVKNNATHDHGNCSQTNSTWTYFTPNVLISNNVECSFELVIYNGTMVILNLLQLSLGDYPADYLGYYKEENEFVEITTDRSYWNKYMFIPYKNKKPRHLKWKFFTDGSIAGFGFDLQFLTYECKCSNKTIPCDGTTHSVIDPQGHGFFCGNMECEFILEPCNDAITMLYLSFFNVADIFGNSFQIYSNNILLHEIIADSRIYFKFYLNSTNANIFKVTTFSSGSLQFSTSSFATPAISTKIKLTSDNPLYVIDIQRYRLILIEISEEMEPYDYAFEIHKSNSIFLFNNESLTYEVEEKWYDRSSLAHLQSLKHDSFCKIVNLKTFVIFGDNDFATISTSAIQLLNTKKECVFGRRIFCEPSMEKPFSFLARPETPCTILFLSNAFGGVLFIKEAWTTSRHEPVKVLVGISQNKTFFEYNAATQSHWKNILLMADIYTIVIPRNSSVFLDIGISSELTINITEFPFYSTASTMCYEVLDRYCLTTPTAQTYILGNYPVKFTVTYFNVSQEDPVGLTVAAKSFRFNKIGDSYIFRNTNVIFDYFYPNSPRHGYYNYGVIIFIETINCTMPLEICIF